MSGIERVGVLTGRLHRSTPAYGDVGDTGCVVVVTRVLDSPDVDQAQRLVDVLFEASADTPPAAGLIRAHFFVSVDGSRMLNYALWTSAQAHRQAIENVPPPLAADERWQQVRLRGTTFRRYRPLLHLTRPAP